MTLICLSCAWVVGIWLGATYNPPATSILSGLILLPLLLFLRQYRKLILLASFCLIALFAGAFYFQTDLPAVDENSLQFYNDRGPVAIRAIIEKAPEVRDKTTQLRLKAMEIESENRWHEVSGTVLIFVPRYPAYQYGDVLLVIGKLSTPLNLDDFDYKDYLAHQGIFSTMLYPEIEIIERGKGLKPLEWIYSLRRQLSQKLAEVLPEPQASLAQGIIFGIRENIPPAVTAAFSQTGTAHLLAISGLHLSVVTGILLSIGIWLFGRRHYIYIWLALAMIWLYALLTGMNPPVVRGAIMASLFLTAELLGRQRSAFVSLTFAAAIMAGISPQILWDASFQLTFLAMAGLIFIAPIFINQGKKGIAATMGEEGIGVSLTSVVADSLSVTFAAILAVWPLVAYYFGVVSLVAPAATFLALPALPGIIVTGVLTGVLGLFAPPVAQVIAWLAWFFLSYLLRVVDGFASIPLSSFEVSSINVNMVWTYYLLLGLALWCNGYHRQLSSLASKLLVALRPGIEKVTGFFTRMPVIWIIPPLLLVAILASLTAITMPDDRLHISFLDVGHGDAILISRGTQQVLVDGGPSPQALGMRLGDNMPFWDRTIELVVLTHPHDDHVAGLVEVLDRYKVKQVLYPDLDFNSAIYDKWLSLLKEKNVRYTLARAGQQIELGEGASISVLNPQEPILQGTQSDTDNNSVALRLSMGSISFLLTADIMQEAELELIARRADLSSTVLKVAHNGSDTSTTPEFLAVAGPRIAVISVGKDDPYGHPSGEVMARLEEKLGSENIYRTDKQGTIEFITNGERLWMRLER